MGKVRARKTLGGRKIELTQKVKFRFASSIPPIFHPLNPSYISLFSLWTSPSACPLPDPFSVSIRTPRSAPPRHFLDVESSFDPSHLLPSTRTGTSLSLSSRRP